MATSCTQCGRECDDLARFCAQCGAPIVPDRQLAGPRVRVLAGIIDAMVFGFAGLIAGLGGALVFFDGGFVVGVGLVWLAWVGYRVFGFAAGDGIGMQAMGLRLVDARTGGEPGVRRAVIRLLVSVPSLWALCLGYLWMLWDRNRQTWHDKVAGTLVVRDASVAPRATPPTSREY